jgi:manganese oxidase
MNLINKTIRASGVLAVSVTAVLMLLYVGNARAGARIDGISGTSFSFTTGTGEISTPDGGSVHFWGYQETTGAANPFGVPQYPGPTLILNQGDEVTITLTSGLPVFPDNDGCTSMVFPGHAVTNITGGDRDGLLTRETCPGGTAVEYTFTATQPGTYTYYSGTEPELQIEMGLVGAIIVRPNMGEDYAYNDASTRFDHEYLFLMTQMDPVIHQLVEQGRFSAVDLTHYWPVYWFFNGRAGPDDLADAFVSWLPHQPYNCTPRMTPGQKLLMRLVGGDQGQHPFHYHGNNADIIARDGRLLAHSRSQFTTLSVPGETVDQIFQWTGKNLGWDIYGTPADGMPAHNCIDNDADGYADVTSDFPWEWCADHGKPLPVVLPEQQNLAFGGWWSGSPFMGSGGQLPPGEGGLNPNAGYFFMWHSHAEKELTNWDIFPGGMMSMMVVEPPGTPIP